MQLYGINVDSSVYKELITYTIKPYDPEHPEELVAELVELFCIHNSHLLSKFFTEKLKIFLTRDAYNRVISVGYIDSTDLYKFKRKMWEYAFIKRVYPTAD